MKQLAARRYIRKTKSCHITKYVSCKTTEEVQPHHRTITQRARSTHLEFLFQLTRTMYQRFNLTCLILLSWKWKEETLMYVQNWRYDWTEATKEILLLKWMAYYQKKRASMQNWQEYVTIFNIKYELWLSLWHSTSDKRIANDIRQSEERTKELLETQMQELRALMTNRHSSYWDTMYRLLICHVWFHVICYWLKLKERQKRLY